MPGPIHAITNCTHGVQGEVLGYKADEDSPGRLGSANRTTPSSFTDHPSRTWLPFHEKEDLDLGWSLHYLYCDDLKAR